MVALPFSVALGQELTGRASVIDADTIEIHGRRIRLHGVDAPEKGQECFLSDGTPWRGGQRGALALAEFIAVSPVTCQPVDTDRYGRVVANCHVRGRDIEEWLVSEGWAMAYRRYSSHYIGAEQVAKNAKRGIWAGTVQPPWEWRHQSRPRHSSPPSP
jgi:endonuclease YncB( thermonuclease family)